MHFLNLLPDFSVFSDLMITTVVDNIKHYFSISFLFISVMVNTDEIVFALSIVSLSLMP